MSSCRASGVAQGGGRGSERGDPRHDFARKMRRQPIMQIHVRAVEQWVAFGEHHDIAAGVQVLAQPLSGLVVEIVDGAVVAQRMISRPGRHGIDQQFLDDLIADQRIGDGASDRSAGSAGVVGDHISVLDQPRRLEE